MNLVSGTSSSCGRAKYASGRLRTYRLNSNVDTELSGFMCLVIRRCSQKMRWTLYQKRFNEEVVEKMARRQVVEAPSSQARLTQ